jgi:hypothetical protein
MSARHRSADPRLTAEQVRELDELDRVLAWRLDADPDLDRDPELEPLGVPGSLAGVVRAVRDDRPPLRPAFADELDSRFAAGFPRRRADFAPRRAAAAGGPSGRPPGLRGGRIRLPRGGPRRALLGLGAVASAIVVASFALPGGATPPPAGDAPSASSAALPAPAPAIVPGSAGAAGGSSASSSPPATRAPAALGVQSAGPPGVQSAAPPGVQSAAPGGAARAVERDATLALLAPEGRVQQVSDEVIGATDRFGGIVESSNVSVDDRGGSLATLSLEVPSGDLDGELAALSSLAHVSSRAQSTLDITDATGAARDRLAASRDERDALLRQLGRASTPNQVASIDAQLGLVGGRIAQDEKDLETLQGRGRYASLGVTITEPPSGSGAGAGHSPWTPGGAVDDALKVLEAAFAILVIGLAGLVPAAVLGVLAWWAARGARRRRRQAALAA